MSTEKMERNARIFALSKEGGGTLSIRQLAGEYNVDAKTIFRIIHREKGKKK